MSVGFEYITGVFGVGLEGFSAYDHDELNAYAELGWEPFMVTGVHNGMAVLILFRRPLPGPPPAKKAATKKPAAKKPATKKPAAKRPATGRTPAGRAASRSR